VTTCRDKRPGHLSAGTCTRGRRRREEKECNLAFVSRVRARPRSFHARLLKKRKNVHSRHGLDVRARKMEEKREKEKERRKKKKEDIVDLMSAAASTENEAFAVATFVGGMFSFWVAGCDPGGTEEEGGGKKKLRCCLVKRASRPRQSDSNHDAQRRAHSWSRQAGRLKKKRRKKKKKKRKNCSRRSPSHVRVRGNPLSYPCLISIGVVTCARWSRIRPGEGKKGGVD